MESLPCDEPITICRLLFNKEKVEAFQPQFRIDCCHHGGKFSNGPIRNPLLSAVDPPAAIHFGGKRSCPTEVRSGLVFRKADCPDFLTLNGRHQDPLLNLFVSEAGNEVGSHQDLHDRRHGKPTGPSCQFLIEDHLSDGIGLHSAICLFMP